MLGVATASAQSITTGAVQGRVTDKDTGLALPGVTVTIGSQVTNTDENGNYKITELIPGTYEVVFEFDTTRAVRRGIVVSANGVTSLFHPLKIGEAVFIDGSPPPINIVSQAKETRIGRKAIESLPTGPTFEATLRNVAGTQNDGVGIAVSGSSALENRYLVDGIDITGLTYGDVGTSLLNDFIHEVQVVSGGYNAEYGRSTGGVVNIVTRSGTDEFRGSVFGVVTPGFLTAKRDAAPSNASSIDVTGDNAYNGHFGFELGGPIIKKRAWFYIGMAPQLARTNYTRVTKSQTDCRVRMDNGELSTCSPANADTDPDVDPKTGFYITDEIDREVRSATAKSAQVITKINVAATPDDQLQLSLIAVPNKSESPALFGLPATGTRTWGLTTDTAARWTSKLNKGATEIEALGAWHRSTANSGSIDPAYDDVPLQQLYSVDLVKMAALGGESAATAAGCQDFPGNPNDKYPLITNCPNNFNAYAVGGPGPLARDLEERRAGRFGLLHRIKAAGTHELKGGLDFEDNRKTKARLYSGGALIQNLGNSIQVNRYAELARPGENDPKFDRMCTISNDSSTGASMGGELVPCRYLGGLDDPSTRVEGHSVNWGAYLQDSWHPLQNLTFNAGMRYEEQRLYYAERLRGTPNPLTGEPLGDTAMKLRGNWSPRLGAIWDPSGEAKSKIYGAWGRYYEGIPMDINDRSFGGEVTLQQTYSPASCGPIDPKLGQVDGATCLGKTPESETMIGANGTLIAPGIKAQYMDEALLGGEIALPSNVVLGAVLQYRRLGRVIEDVSTDNAQTYLIANPGEWSREEEAKLVHQIATTTDKLLKGRLEEQLRMFQGVRIFDKPRRDYAAIELTVSRKFISGLYLSGSYTYSRAVGNYPGLVSYDNGQIDPNISSQYDLIELLANRAGKLPQDRPHYIKLDAYRDFDLGNESVLTVGGRVRALSGIPQNALGAHYLYGADESFLLPRGQIGRTEFEHGIDLHLGYKRKLTQGSTAELYVDVFNLYDRQGTFRVDETYAPQYSVSVAGAGGIEQNVNPISGGTYEDLLWAKTIDRNGVESSTPI
ncbi:MAG TPA: TonB-dependent receptor, partial [Kofleriaceae bacterium]|nr:TonB-dependent receptor [Kofleriaceae bacterium]